MWHNLTEGDRDGQARLIGAHREVAYRDSVISDSQTSRVCLLRSEITVAAEEHKAFTNLHEHQQQRPTGANMHKGSTKSPQGGLLSKGAGPAFGIARPSDMLSKPQ